MRPWARARHRTKKGTPGSYPKFHSLGLLLLLQLVAPILGQQLGRLCGVGGREEDVSEKGGEEGRGGIAPSAFFLSPNLNTRTSSCQAGRVLEVIAHGGAVSAHGVAG